MKRKEFIRVMEEVLYEEFAVKIYVDSSGLSI